MTTIRPRRSVLYMPGSNARALEKARSLPADGVILDLEDAVAPDAKELARQQVLDAVAAGGFGPREIIIRVNGLNTPWGPADLAAAAKAGPDAILVPKVNSALDIARVASVMRSVGAPARTRLWVMMETPLAMLKALDIAGAAVDSANRLTAFVMGTNDLAKETRARLIPGRAPMLPWLATCVAAARSFGLDILDGVYNDLGDEPGFIAECEQGRDLGMDGKTLIHPNQIAAANRAFSPTDDEVAQARRIIAAFALPENADKGVIPLEGRMVERMHAEMGARTVAIAEAIAARG
jgi:citrate lyase subunit beta/citryl-CoA lyase